MFELCDVDEVDEVRMRSAMVSWLGFRIWDLGIETGRDGRDGWCETDGMWERDVGTGCIVCKFGSLVLRCVWYGAVSGGEEPGLLVSG